MKPIVSGVANSPAMMKSPSFSRLSSSVTTIMRPAFSSSSAATTLSRPKAFEALAADATGAVAEAILSRRPDVAKEKKALLASVAPHVKSNPAPEWLMACGFFCQALLPLQLGVADADGCAIS
mmetsp:Transcript_37764/g.99127  ORF Transcript_37764/g.99127 Transcript_37764/m.99127 type:complete len:123 (+) Transcript_37764:666-1034(+)